MDMAERKGGALRRVLASAERLSDSAIRFGSCQVKTPSSSSSAKLSRVTLADQVPDVVCRVISRKLLFRAGRALCRDGRIAILWRRIVAHFARPAGFTE